jgi:hypothetical protein
MSPFTHLLASWVVAAQTTDNVRDTRWVALAGVLPDLDGMGIVVDLFRDPTLKAGAYYYEQYHHWLAHGIVGGVVIALFMACLGRNRWKVFFWSLVVFHLHLACDLLGSRGEELNAVWPIHYLGPLSHHWTLTWSHQWKLDGWQNKLIGVSLLATAFWMAAQRGHSFVGVFNRWLDRHFVTVLQKWIPARMRRDGSLPPE